MSSQFASSFKDQTTSPTILQSNGTAKIYGPSASRGYGADQSQYAQQQQTQQFDSSLSNSFGSSGSGSGTGRHGGVPRTAFYNTREGEAVISQARSELSARAKPVDHNTHRSTVQDNRQRAYHGECVLPANLANQAPVVSPVFTEYPLQEYNRFSSETRSWSGPTTHPRLKSVPYSKPNSSMDVARRHDLVKNLKKNESISNYDHNLPFLAKHTNNLVSC